MTNEDGGEDRNRTYLATCVATTVLKTARATRHPSLSGLRKTPNAQPRKRRNGQAVQRPTPNFWRAKRALECGGPPQDGFDEANLTPLSNVQPPATVYGRTSDWLAILPS